MSNTTCQKLFNGDTLIDGYSFNQDGAIVNNNLNMVVCDPKTLNAEETKEFTASHPTQDISSQFTENQVSSTVQHHGISNPLQTGPSPLLMAGFCLIAGVVALVAFRAILKKFKSRKDNKNAKRV